MPEPFKNFFSADVIATIAGHLARVYPAFDADVFHAQATDNLETLELKERSRQITATLESHLPDDFAEAAGILVAALRVDDGAMLDGLKMDETGVAGFPVMPLADFIADYGQDHFDVSMAALKEMTKRFSAEFAIRPFINRDPERVLAVLRDWVGDANPHVRRLVSEGSRTRLPWGERIPAFISDPAPVLPLLEALKDDPEEYVRRSVANNLNDIAKDHPDLVARIAGDWMQGASRNRERLVRHACRTLIKQGHEGCLEALGYGAPEVELESLAIRTPTVRLGGALEFDLALHSTGAMEQGLIIDFVIHHRKADGGLSPKVFKWKNLSLKAGARFEGGKKHPMKPITTRVYHAGVHRLEIKVNGQILAGQDFELQL